MAAFTTREGTSAVLKTFGRKDAGSKCVWKFFGLDFINLTLW